uniref:Uncharacterized protein n=1 Tax=Peromyscus maniculatus bairdii TaxID=230844 RepID=A0A8C8U975_PERMB
MGHNHNQLVLLMTNGLKITNHLLLSKSHSISNCSYHNPNPMKLYRSNHTNYFPWTHLITTILSNKY